MEKWSSKFRVWHWLFALTFIFSSLSVLVLETVMDREQVSVTITHNLNNFDIQIAKEDAVFVARKLRSPFWQWHIWSGYLFGALFLARLALFTTSSGKRSYIKFDEKSLHKKIVSIVYILIYVLAFFIIATGLVINFYQELGFSRELRGIFKDIHQIAFYLMLPLALAHIAGVVIAENKDEQGIVSSMINGKVN